MNPKHDNDMPLEIIFVPVKIEPTEERDTLERDGNCSSTVTFPLQTEFKVEENIVTVTRKDDETSTGVKIETLEQREAPNEHSYNLISSSIKDESSETLEVIETRSQEKEYRELENAYGSHETTTEYETECETGIEVKYLDMDSRFHARYFENENHDEGEKVEGIVTGVKSPERNFMCPQCGHSFPNSWGLKRHLKRHFGKREFSCLVCGKAFIFNQHLKDHELIHSMIRPYVCKLCDKSFKRPSNLRNHMLSHTKKNIHHDGAEASLIEVASRERNFTCAQCEKSFPSKWGLTKHLKLHSGIRPFQCLECSKSFVMKEHLKAHEILHTGIRPYACTLCDKTFVKSSNLRCHMKRHTNEKPFICKQCGKSFSEKGSRKRHEKIHRGEKL